MITDEILMMMIIWSLIQKIHKIIDNYQYVLQMDGVVKYDAG